MNLYPTLGDLVAEHRKNSQDDVAMHSASPSPAAFSKNDSESIAAIEAVFDLP